MHSNRIIIGISIYLLVSSGCRQLEPNLDNRATKQYKLELPGTNEEIAERCWELEAIQRRKAVLTNQELSLLVAELEQLANERGKNWTDHDREYCYALVRAIGCKGGLDGFCALARIFKKYHDEFVKDIISGELVEAAEETCKQLFLEALCTGTECYVVLEDLDANLAEITGHPRYTEVYPDGEITPQLLRNYWLKQQEENNKEDGQ